MYVSIPETTASPLGSYDFSCHLYWSYVKWDGTTCPYKGDTSELKEDQIYRVVRADVRSSYTYLYLEELNTGKVLSHAYNNEYFQPLKGSVGLCHTKPIVGKSAEIEIYRGKSLVRASTSIVRAVEWVSSKTINIITENSVYTCLYTVD